MAKRRKYDPRLMRFLVEELAKKNNSGTNAASLNTLAISLSGTAESKGLPAIGDTYISKLYKESEKAIKKGEPIVKEDKMINNLIGFIDLDSYELFEDAFNEKIGLDISNNPELDFASITKGGSKSQGNSSYNLQARILPLSIGLLPLLSLLISLPFNKPLISSLQDLEIALTLVLGVGGMIFIIIAFSDLNAGLSKVYQNKYFKKVNGFPTSYLMLYGDPTFSNDYKDKYREKVLKLTGIKLLNKEDEVEDKVKATQTLNTATEYVKQYVYEGLVKTQNIRYGFTRNLIGTTFLGIPFSIMTSIVGVLSNSVILIILSASMLTLYFVILIFKKHLLIEAAEAYAKELLTNFLKNY